MNTKFSLPENLVTENGTKFINNEMMTLCLFYKVRQRSTISHAPWTNGLVKGMNCSLQEYLPCIINGVDEQYAKCSTNQKLMSTSK